MTFRARSAPRPTRRRVRRSDTRRAIYVTLMFSLAIASAVALMGGVFLADYYSAHGAPIAAVNGEVISKDAVRDRVALDQAIWARQIANLQSQRNRGQVTTDEYTSLVGALQTKQTSSTLYSDALTQLINEATLRQYASKNGVTVSDAAIDAQIQTDATTPDMRHVKIISVATQATPPSNSRTLSDSITALGKAQGYLKEVQGGKKWDDVVKEATATSSSTAGTTGDLGLIARADLKVDPDFADAIFALQKPNDVTAIFKGTDGGYRFATITSIAPKNTDGAWNDTISSTSNGDVYRSYARAEATQKAVQSAVEAKYINGPTLQRHVLEIAMSPGYGQPGNGDEVKLAMMVFAPNHSVAGAASVVSSDPAWTDAKNRAQAAVDALRKDPSKFASMAEDTTVNDEQYFNTAGGDVPWIPADLFQATTASQQSGLGMPSVSTAVFKDGVTPGSILDPIEEPSQGYVVVLFEGRRPAPDQRIANAQFAINNGADFSQQARLNSESADAIVGGDMGWVSPYMLTLDQERVAFATPLGSVSNLLAGNGFFAIYKVVEQATRAVTDPAQQAKLKKVVFPRWLSDLQANALVWQDAAALTAMAPAAPTQ